MIELILRPRDAFPFRTTWALLRRFDIDRMPFFLGRSRRYENPRDLELRILNASLVLICSNMELLIVVRDGSVSLRHVSWRK